MMIEENAVAKGRRNLAKLKKQKNPGITGLNFVIRLAPDIRARLAEGHRLEEVWSAIFDPLPAKDKLTLTTFRKYWQIARAEAGLKPLKNWTTNKTVVALEPEEAATPVEKKETATDFRDDPEGI